MHSRRENEAFARAVAKPVQLSGTGASLYLIVPCHARRFTSLDGVVAARTFERAGLADQVPPAVEDLMLLGDMLGGYRFTFYYAVANVDLTTGFTPLSGQKRVQGGAAVPWWTGNPPIFSVCQK